MDLNLRGKVAVITGATGGIGSTVARMLTEEGASCVLVARRHERLAALAAELSASRTIAADVTDPASAARVVTSARETAGRIDILVNAAGNPPSGSFWQLPESAWHAAFAKVLATVVMLQAVLPLMRVQQGGRAVTIIGETGRQPRPGLLPGAAANAALLAVTKGVAVDVAADGVAVNAVSPGPTRTPRLEAIFADEARRRGVGEAQVLEELVADCPAGTLAEPEDIARAVLFLASDAAGHITGTALTVDGGRTRGIP